jgi:hypothetical protein
MVLEFTEVPKVKSAEENGKMVRGLDGLTDKEKFVLQKMFLMQSFISKVAHIKI